MIEVRMRPGIDVKDLVDAFYSQNGVKGRARPDDLFFMAYQSDQLIGCVRYCFEENTPMLRTMMIDPNHRRSSVGRTLLIQFEKYLIQHDLKNTFCLPYPHLENFYGIIGFKKVSEAQVPVFLRKRMQEYQALSYAPMIFMERK